MRLHRAPRSRRSLGLALIALLGACGKADKAPGPSALSSEQCRREAEDFDALLEKTNTEPVRFDTARLVERTDVPKAPRPEAVALALAPGRASVELRPVPSAALASALVDAHRAVGAARVDIAIEQETSWPEVVEAFNAARFAGFTSIGLVFKTTVLASAPARSPADDQIDEVLKYEPSERPSRLADIVVNQVKDCDALRRLFASFTVGAAEEKEQRFRSGLSAALIECDCKVDLPGFKTFVWRFLSNDHPERVIVLEPDAGAEKIGSGAASKWKDVANRIRIDAKNAVLVVN